MVRLWRIRGESVVTDVVGSALVRAGWGSVGE
jgi:hypothetical protein